MTDTQLAQHVLPQELIALHLFSKDVSKVRALTMDAVKALAALPEDQFEPAVPRVLMLLTVYDHMTDQRTSGMIADYLNF